MPSKPGEIEMVFSEAQATERPADSPSRVGPTNRMTMAARARRSTGVVKWISAALIVMALFVIIRGAATVREPLRRKFSDVWNNVGPKSVVVLVRRLCGRTLSSRIGAALDEMS